MKIMNGLAPYGKRWVIHGGGTGHSKMGVILRIEIKEIIEGKLEIVHIKAVPEAAGVYIRFGNGDWFHLIDRNGGTYLRVFDPQFFETAYQLWKRNEQKIIQVQNKSS